MKTQKSWRYAIVVNLVLNLLIFAFFAAGMYYPAGIRNTAIVAAGSAVMAFVIRMPSTIAFTEPITFSALRESASFLAFALLYSLVF